MTLPESPFLPLLWVGVLLFLLFGGKSFSIKLRRCLPIAFFLALLAAGFSSRQQHPFIRYKPGTVADSVQPPTSLRLVGQNSSGVFVEDPTGVIRTGRGDYVAGRKFIPSRFIGAHFHRVRRGTVVCRAAHVPAQLSITHQNSYPRFGRGFLFHWWPALTVGLALAWLVFAGPVVWLAREGALLFMAHRGIPPVWQSEFLKKHIHKMTERVKAELTRLRQKASKPKSE